MNARTVLMSLGIAVTCATTMTIAAATINVTVTANSPGGAGDCTLGEAIIAANTNAAVDGCSAGSGADTINLPAGTYTLTTALPQIDSVVTIQGVSSATTIVIRATAAPAFRIFDASGGSADTTLNNLDIVNGLIVGDAGGGVYTRGRPLTVNDSRLRDNTATNGSGGAIATSGFLGTTTINNTIFMDNQATFDGGAIQIGGALTITGSTFNSNDSSNGGAIHHAGGSASILNTTISNNTSTGRGGGIGTGVLALISTMTITDSVISGNVAALDGGGAALAAATITNTRIFGNTTADFGGGLHFGDSATITGSTVNGNLAVFGGGIANRGNSGAVVTLTNSTVSGNSATNDGGGLYVDIGGTFDLRNATVTNNIADSDANGSGNGGGIFRGSAVDVFLRNTILAGNHDGLEVGITKTESQDPATVGTPFTYTLTVTKTGSNPDCAGDVTSNGNNLIGNTDGCTVTLLPSDIAGTGAAPVDPRLGPLQNNGGSTQTHALETGSPAIDKGSGCPATDQRGVARPVGPACDIGSYEGSVAASGTGASTGFTVTDTLPAQVTFQSVSTTQGTCTGTTTVTCNLGPVANGASIPIAITVLPNSAAVVTNTGTASATGGLPGSTPSASANQQTVLLAAPPPAADVSITKTAAPPAPVAGDNISYTITVTNSGPDSATNVTVTDPVPAGTTLVSSSSTQGTCSGTTSVTCSVGTLASGGTATITIVVATSTAGPVVNIATVTATEADPDAADNSGQVTTQVAALAVAAIPTLDGLALLAFALALAAAALMAMRPT